MLVSTDTTNVHGAYQLAATASNATPNPDTLAGSAGTSPNYMRADASAPKSGLYDLHGQDDLHTVGASGSGVTIPASSANQSNYILLTAASVAITMPTAGLGFRMRMALKQDSSGSRVPGFPTNVGWASTHPTWSTGPGLIDVIDFYCFDGTNWLGWPVALGVVLPSPPMSIIQSAMGHNVSPITLPGNVTRGDGLVFISDWGTSPSGGGSSSWVQVVAQTFSSSYLDEIWIGYDSAGGAGSNHVAFANYNGYVIEVAGLALSSAVDVTESDSGSGAISPTTMTASENGGLVLVGVYGATQIITTPSSPWTVVRPFPFSNNIALAYQLNTTSGNTYPSSWAQFTTGAWCANSCILKP